MLTVTIILLACITFGTRYLFIHPTLPLTLSGRMQKLLSYSAPAVLSAIWIPIVFVQQGKFNTDINSAYLWGAAVACFFAWKTRSIYATAITGGIVFVAIKILV